MEHPTLNDQEAWLAHYTTAHTAFNWIVPDQRLLMNPYVKMRDPIENKEPFFTGGGGFGDTEQIERRFFTADMLISRMRDGFRLTSFTQAAEKPDPQFSVANLLAAPWARPRMWEQYGDNHQGVCLVFDRAALLLNSISMTHVSKPVVYTPAGYAGSEGARGLADLSTVDPDNIAAATLAIQNHVLDHFDDFFFTKSDDWAAEHEFRIIYGHGPKSAAVTPDRDTNVYLTIKDSLRYVVLGENFPDWQVPAALAAVEGFDGVEVRRMSWTLGQAWPGNTLIPRSRRR